MIDRNKIAELAIDAESPWAFIHAEATRLGLSGPQRRDFLLEMGVLLSAERALRRSQRREAREALYAGEKTA